MKIDKAVRRDRKRDKASKQHKARVSRRAIEPTLLRKVVFGTLKRKVVNA